MAMRKPFWLMFTADGDDPNSGGGSGSGGSDKDLGFPKDTPLVEMTTEQQLAYWKHHARKHEGVAQSRADYDQQKADAERWRQAQEANKKPDEKLLDQARQEAAEAARREEQAKLAPRLVKAEFKSAAAGKLSKELLDAFLEDVNHSVYLKADGELDTEKIQKRVEALAPKVDQKQQKRTPTHQGYRPADGATSIAAGRDLFESRNKKG